MAWHMVGKRVAVVLYQAWAHEPLGVVADEGGIEGDLGSKVVTDLVQWQLPQVVEPHKPDKWSEGRAWAGEQSVGCGSLAVG